MSKRSKDFSRLSSFTVIVVCIALAMVGIAMIPLLPVKLVPSRSMPSLTVNFTMPNHSARVIESEVTSKLESMLSRVQGVKEISSTSSNNSGSISISLDKHVDMEATRFEVSTIVRQAWAELPRGVSYPTITTRQVDNKASRPFLTYTINAPASPIEIQRYAEEYIKPVIGQIKGIYSVDLSGATPMEWQLEYDNDQLKALGLTPADLSNAIVTLTKSTFLGIADFDGDWLRVTASTLAEGEEATFDPSVIEVDLKDGSAMTLDKLVKVRHVEQAATSYFRINGLNSIYCNIKADEDANQIELAKKVRLAMDGLIAALPQGYMVNLRYDGTETINNELNKIYFRTGLTLAILLLFVGLITLNVRYMLVVTISLLINLSIAVIFYYLLAIEIQLYSLAGITISLNLIIDNIIVMTDHIRHKANLKAFTSILAATLTTIGALGVVFFLDEEIRLNLVDFVIVVIVNLAVSLMVALFLVPALITRIGMRQQKRGRISWRKRFAVRFTRVYGRFVAFTVRHKAICYIILILSFGLPTYLLPESIKDSHTIWATAYNKTIGSDLYNKTLRPWVDKCLGGSLRLFAKDVFSGGYFGRSDGEVVLSVNATLPNGTTLDQMNELIQRMEAYLTTFKEIRQFQTSVAPRRASMQIYFTPEAAASGFPYTLKSDIIAKALTLGGGSWSVYGLQDNGFNNDVRESAGDYRIKMLGYNYDELEHWAAVLKDILLERRRIKEVTIKNEFSWWKDDYTEFYLDIDKERLAKAGLTISQLYGAMQPIYGGSQKAATLYVDGEYEDIILLSRQGQEYDVWSLMNVPLQIGDKSYKLADLATMAQRNAPPSISKENQQYRLCLQYSYIGSSQQGKKLLEQDLERINSMMPVGYTAENVDRSWRFGDNNGSNWWLLVLVIVVIFFTSSILFNSLRQPIGIILTIPIAFIGVFLIFYLTEMKFDQGGFAAFILLCGITVNAAIYVLNEYNTLRENHPRQNPLRLYLKAWNIKVLPIFLTVVSTILGFLPFLIGTTKESFWFPLALGTIGGLAMSLVGVFFFLPLFILKRRDMPSYSSPRRR
ncbi:MAG: efflux RND transporter permease subunit [Bacteroidales bacterium]|nr:efflux RND transporter permease subunit [Bacteroidales bacterium]